MHGHQAFDGGLSHHLAITRNHQGLAYGRLGSRRNLGQQRIQLFAVVRKLLLNGHRQQFFMHRVFIAYTIQRSDGAAHLFFEFIQRFIGIYKAGFIDQGIHLSQPPL